MGKELLLGITEKGVCHAKGEKEFDLETKFAMVRDSGVYDYFDKSPEAPELIDDYLRFAEKYRLPIRAGGWFYTLGRDEALLEANLRTGARLGSRVHNTQILMRHADGHLVTDEEVADIYMRAFDIGETVGCRSTFEVHVNMWSEHYGRVSKVARLVEARGVPFRMTLDHSHVIFKIYKRQRLLRLAAARPQPASA